MYATYVCVMWCLHSNWPPSATRQRLYVQFLLPYWALQKTLKENVNIGIPDLSF